MTRITRKTKSVDVFDTISLSDYQRVAARARMAQAETIAKGFLVVIEAVSRGIAGLRAAFMKPVHH